MNLNSESLTINLDIISEMRDRARVREEASKIQAAKRYNTKVKPRSFHPGDLVWHMSSETQKNEGKFSINWEGLFRVSAMAGKGAYYLKHLSGQTILKTWNATHLKFYFS